MRSRSMRIAALALLTFILCASLSSCGGLAAKYGAYERTGERYDYDLTEYLAIPEYVGIEIPDLQYAPTSEEVENAKYIKLAYFAQEEVVDRPAEKYDLIDCDYSCVVEGQNYSYLDSSVNNSRRSLMVGVGHFGIPEIDDAIIGMMPGETKTIEFTFPEPYLDDVVRSGLKGTMTFTLEKVREQQFDDYNDEFVNEYYGYETTEEYNDVIVEQLTHDGNQLFEGYEKELTWEYLYNNTVYYKYPGKELNEARDRLVERAYSAAEYQNKSIDEYVKSVGCEDMNDYFDKVVDPNALTLVREEMVMLFIARCEGMTLSDAEYQSALINYCEVYETTDVETCEQFVLSDFGSIARFKEYALILKAEDFVASKALKIDTAEYYKNKHEGKYVLSEDEVESFQEAIADETVVIIILCVVAALVLALVIVLVFKLKKENAIKRSREEEKAKIEEKRRIRREIKQAKKNKENSERKPEDTE
ncbi:MAG: hypothetical protein IKN38_08830, partial [Clostridia bacterium]|nr:hypothetical protein [Clostridia bacterium]